MRTASRHRFRVTRRWLTMMLSETIVEARIKESEQLPRDTQLAVPCNTSAEIYQTPTNLNPRHGRELVLQDGVHAVGVGVDLRDAGVQEAGQKNDSAIGRNTVQLPVVDWLCRS